MVVGGGGCLRELVMSNFWDQWGLSSEQSRASIGERSQSARREELEVQPPEFHRLKCKPVSGAVRKQTENFVPLVPYRTRTFPWTRLWTVDTLDAEQDPRRGHNPDTVFFICGFNTMGEFSVQWIGVLFLFFFCFACFRDAANCPTRCVCVWGGGGGGGAWRGGVCLRGSEEQWRC